MSDLTLNPIHVQRLRAAVEAVRQGVEVKFRINPGEPPTLVWVRMDQPGTQHAILNRWSDMPAWKEAVEQRFEAMLIPQAGDAQ